ncbi:MAG: TetR/AcrR family transcriptional regulator [Acidimicrobiia bacterium]
MIVHSGAGRRARAADKREAILAAALGLFSERTFYGTPMPGVAERAGVGAGTIYRYFDGKEALVNAVYQRWKGEMKRILVDAAPRDRRPREEFGHWWRGLWRFATENPEAFAFLETHHHAPYLDAASQRLAEEMTTTASSFLERAQAAGDVRKAPPELLIALVFGAFTGLAKAAGVRGLTQDDERVAETEECVWNMIRASSAVGASR